METPTKLQTQARPAQPEDRYATASLAKDLRHDVRSPKPGSTKTQDPGQ